MTTEFFVEPTITTDSMRTILNKPTFDYVLLCNKICGVAHYNMRMKMVIESADDFKAWYKTQKYVIARDAAPATAPADTAKTAELAPATIKTVAAK